MNIAPRLVRTVGHNIIPPQERVVGGPGFTDDSLSVPPWADAADPKCAGGAHLRRFCALAQYPIGARCGMGQYCCNHPAVVSQSYRLVAAPPTRADFIGPVQTDRGEHVDLYALEVAGDERPEVVAVHRK